MLTCFLFGLGLLAILFLLPVGEKLFSSARYKAFYKYTLFVIYVGGMLWFTLFNRIGMHISSFRFHPFHVLRQMFNCWFGFKKIATSTCQAVFRNSKNLLDSVHASPVEDVFLNIFLFVPLGFLLPHAYPKFNFYKTVLVGFLLSILIETTQYVAQLGCCDIDDIINDTVGTCIGYGCFRLYTKITHK